MTLDVKLNIIKILKLCKHGLLNFLEWYGNQVVNYICIKSFYCFKDKTKTIVVFVNLVYVWASVLLVCGFINMLYLN